MTSQVWWYVARATGLVAWGLLTASVLWGIALSTRALGPRPTAPWLLDLHRYLGGLAVLFVGGHLVAILADSFEHFTVADLVVPMASEWRPGAVAWGVVSLYLLLAVEVTSLLVRHVPRATWRAIHLSSYALFATSTVHLLLSGTDVSNLLVRLVVLAAVAEVLFLTAYRVTVASRARRRLVTTAATTRPNAR